MGDVIEDGDGEEFKQRIGIKKMTPFQAYFALIKAYCAINILLLPKGFRNGGYVLSPIALIVSCFFETLCAIKLAECGRKLNKCSYSDIVYEALG